MKVVLDTAAIIAFCSELEEPDLLKSLLEISYELIVPKKVLQEIVKGETITVFDKHLSRVTNVVSGVRDNAFHAFMDRYPYLGAGEADVILHGELYGNEGEEYICIIDDRRARNVAMRIGVNLCGTLGLLGTMMSAGLLTPSHHKDCIERLRSSNFRME